MHGACSAAWFWWDVQGTSAGSCHHPAHTTPKPHPLARSTACAQVPRSRQAQTSISVVHGHKPDGSGLLNMLLSLFGWRSQQRNKVSVDCSTLAALKQGLKCSLLLRLVFPGGKLRHTAVGQLPRILQDLTEGKLS